ncbi:MAG: hypothetical protein JRC68_02590 [Deltaproteobacteria bacterium]|nr:hypothetical protein [Deltaproteobacteria bacterium]
MKCKNHPNRDAEQFCKSCGIPVCNDCTEEAKPGEYYCFQCAMLHSVSAVGTSIVDKRDQAEKKKLEKKKAWGPFHYFVIVASVMIAVMWSVIIFGGKKAPGNRIDFSKNQRVFLFMVDSSIKRYARYEGNKYPDQLKDIIPKYLSLQKEDLVYLEKLSYKRDPKVGYRLSFTNPKPGEINIIISPKGIQHEPSLRKGV